MIAALLLLASAPTVPTAIDAERAFAAMAQRQGQWASFRAYAAPEAYMFVPEATNAQAFLKDRAEPPVPVMWWPGRSWVACDGSLAVNTGPWVRAGGNSSGTFTTVWRRDAGGTWKWLLDHGRATPRAVPAADAPLVARPVCTNLNAATADARSSEPGPDLLVQLEDRMPASELPQLAVEEGDVITAGASPDGSLRWEARLLIGNEEGAHLLRVWLWDGTGHRLALYEASGVKAP